MDPMFMEPEAGRMVRRVQRDEPRARYAVGERRCDRRTRAVPGQRRRGQGGTRHRVLSGRRLRRARQVLFPALSRARGAFATGALRWQQSRYEQFQAEALRNAVFRIAVVQPARQARSDHVRFPDERRRQEEPVVARRAACAERDELLRDSARTRAGGLDLHAGSVRRITARLRRPPGVHGGRDADGRGRTPARARRSRSVAPIFRRHARSARARDHGCADPVRPAARRVARPARTAPAGANGSAPARNALRAISATASDSRWRTRPTATSGDGMFGMVQILPDSRLRVVTPYTDMGNGAATTLPAPSEFRAERADDRHERDRAVQCTRAHAFEQPVGQSEDGAPRTSPSSACLGAFHQYHAVKGAARTCSCSSAGGPCVWACPCGPRDAIGGLRRERPRADFVAAARHHHEAGPADGGGRACELCRLLLEGRPCSCKACSSRTASRRFCGRRCSAPSRSWACRRRPHASWRRLLLEGHLSVRVGSAQIDYDYVAVGLDPYFLTPLYRTLQARRVDTSSTGARPMRHRRRSSACPSIRRTGA